MCTVVSLPKFWWHLVSWLLKDRDFVFKNVRGGVDTCTAERDVNLVRTFFLRLHPLCTRYAQRTIAHSCRLCYHFIHTC